MAKRKVVQPKQLNNNMGVQSGVNLTGMTMSLKPVVSQIAMLQQPHLPWEVDQKLGHKSPPVRATSNLSMTSYCLIKARAKQCLITLHKEDQGMTILENWKERQSRVGSEGTESKEVSMLPLEEVEVSE